MIDHMEPSLWGMAVCNGGQFLFGILMTMAVGIDPITIMMG